MSLWWKEAGGQDDRWGCAPYLEGKDKASIKKKSTSYRIGRQKCIALGRLELCSSGMAQIWKLSEVILHQGMPMLLLLAVYATMSVTPCDVSMPNIPCRFFMRSP